MIDYFKQHFHLKKQSGTVPPGYCVANFVGTAQEPFIDLCGDTVCISVECLINHGNPPQKGNNKKQNQTEEGKKPVKPIIDDPTPREPNPPVVDPPVIGDPEPPEYSDDADDKQVAYSQYKYAVIGQLNQASVEKPFAENDNYVYFMQSTYGDNAVLAVNKKTGLSLYPW